MSLVSEETGVDVNVGDSLSASNLWGGLIPGGDIAAPTASAQEAAINQMIMDSLQSSNALSEALMPYMMAEMGYTYTSTPGVAGGKPTYTITKIPWEQRLAGMSPQEQRQYQMQDKLMQQQFAAMGYNPDTLEQFKTEEESWNYMSPQQLLANGVDPTTKTRLTEEQRYARLDDIGKAQYDVQKESLGMQLKGLRGELPISPGLERDLAKGQELTDADLSQRLGPNWKQSTAGIQTEAKFGESANIARDAARRGWLGDTAGMASGVGADIRANKAFNQNSVGAVSPNLGLLGGLYQQGAGISQGQQGQRMAGLSGMPSYGQNWQGYSTAMQPYQYYSGLANQANMQNSANKATTTAGLYGLIGNAVGTGGALYALSSKDYKKDIKKHSSKDDDDILDMIKNNDTFSYRYKDEAGSSPKRVGLITEHSPMGMGLAPDRKHIDIGKTVGVLTTATKALAKKVDKLERRS